MAEFHPPIGGVHEAALYVADLDRAERFWRRLGLPLVGRSEGRHVFFRVALDVPDAAALESWRRHLAEAGVAIEAETQWPRGGSSLYFRDPDGNSIELITRGSWGF